MSKYIGIEYDGDAIEFPLVISVDVRCRRGGEFRCVELGRVRIWTLHDGVSLSSLPVFSSYTLMIHTPMQSRRWASEAGLAPHKIYITS